MILCEKENNGFTKLLHFINEKYDANIVFDLEFKFIYENETITAKYDTMYESDNWLEDDEEGYEEYNAIAFLNIETDELFEINYLNLPKTIVCGDVEVLWRDIKANNTKVSARGNNMKETLSMKELAVVKLKREFKGLPIGTEGTIVLEYDGTAYEVEYFDSEGDTIEVLTTPVDVIDLVDRS